MYKIVCVFGSSYNRSFNKKFSDYFFTQLDVVKYHVEKLAILHPDCIFEIKEIEK